MQIPAIQSINLTTPYNAFGVKQNNFPNFQVQQNQQAVSKYKIPVIVGVALAVISGVAFCLLTKKPQKISDLAYKNKLADGLKSENINVSASALKSIVGPEELTTLLKKFTSEHFQAGMQTVEKGILPEKFYENAIKGDFRVSLHTHSNFSDGKATPEEFLECARKYADKVARLKKNDGLPPFTIALTDHDSVDGCKEIIKLIAKAPEKYKNLKFVAGCEFSVLNKNKHHDITGLALNPFDKDLSSMLEGLRDARRKSIQEFLNTKNKNNGTNVTMQMLIDAEKDDYAKRNKAGKRCIENASGVVAVRHALKYYHKITGIPINRSELNSLGSSNLLSVEQVVATINKNGAMAALTHPHKSFWSYIGDEELMRLKNIGVKGIEVNHQYTPSKMAEISKNSGEATVSINAYQKLTEQYRAFAEKNGMFVSGGTDCHEKQIFSREPKITEEILNKILT